MSFKAVRNAPPASVELPESESDAVTSFTNHEAAAAASSPAHSDVAHVVVAAAAAAAADTADAVNAAVDVVPAAVRAKDWSKTSPQLVLRRGAETGDRDAIRFAIKAGADINHQESGKGACLVCTR